MEFRYKVTGMTCNGCRATVEAKLNNLPQVEHARVNLETLETVISAKQEVEILVLQQALPPKYKITKTPIEAPFIETSTVLKSDTQRLFPLILVFTYITIAAVALHIKSWDASNFMLDFMGLFYIVFSFFKLLDLKGFTTSFRMYDPLARSLPVYAYVYPFIEVALGVFFLMRFQITIALVVTLIILGITTVGVTKALIQKREIQCACLGTALNLPMTTATFIENSIMIVMALIMLGTM